MTVKPSFLGRGFSFPFQLNEAGSAPAFSSDEEEVRNSIDALLSTGKYDRPFRVKRGVPYGVGVYDVLFESADAAIDLLKFDARTQLSVWEPRIVVQSVDASRQRTQSGMSGISVVITYRFRSTNRSDNFVKFYSTQKEQ